ncbi:Glutathione-dependent formaldehyde-activating enzyme [Enhygromyxa salina]|uniref:Glutathione-dependent formaldehyde-activating enzyme n=2 Tax=Enhygromyxa salina TaxID=215803 RepID=A0A2S9XRB5_9BACT|nr:Glutathione-dependent formaldehyde-activating enzyme [Enhygromyxa salina]
MCGAVRFTADVAPKISACHCGMCRQWTSGVLLSAMAKDVSFEGEDAITVFSSSSWAERGFCSRCGSSLFYRITAEGPHHGAMSIALGVLDEPSGLPLEMEWFIDRKPDGYAFAGEHKRLTEAEALALFTAPEG